jgi:BirA family biotin operon repressor/biotin-[acetyl-CoA-carboxylase] ligase
MDVARELAGRGAPEGTIVIAGEQTAGRGRHGRAWRSPPGGAWFSLVLRPEIEPQAAGQVAVLLGVALAEALREAYGVPVAVKWPNDLWLRSRKLGGILIELSASGGQLDWLVAGIGVNVNNPAPRGTGMKASAISLGEVLGKLAQLEDFYVQALRGIARGYQRFRAEGFEPVRQAWPQLSLLREGDRVWVEGASERRAARVVGLSALGRLVVEWERDRRVEELIAEEVTLNVEA